MKLMFLMRTMRHEWTGICGEDSILPDNSPEMASLSRYEFIIGSAKTFSVLRSISDGSTSCMHKIYAIGSNTYRISLING